MNGKTYLWSMVAVWIVIATVIFSLDNTQAKILAVFFGIGLTIVLGLIEFKIEEKLQEEKPNGRRTSSRPNGRRTSSRPNNKSKEKDA